MSTLFTNAVISVWRRTLDPISFKSAPPECVLRKIPVAIEDLGNRLNIHTAGPSFRLRMTWSPGPRILDGDQIRGYNPTGAALTPIYTTQHVQWHGGYAETTELDYWLCYLIAVNPAGVSG